MVEWLIEPLQYSFFIRGMAAGLVVALACGILSSFIVWRGMAFIGDALAHAVLPGIVISVILGIHILIGALAAAMVTVLGIGKLTEHQSFKDDTAIGVIFAGAFALGILLMSKVATYQDLSHILFGNILGVKGIDLVMISVIAGVVILFVVVFFKELLVSSFDSVHSTAIGLSPKMINYGLLFMVAGTTVIATQTVGVVLVMALLVTPAAAASMVMQELHKIMILSIVFAAFSIISGFYGSYYFDLPAGALIVLILTVVFLFAYGISYVKKKKINS